MYQDNQSLPVSAVAPNGQNILHGLDPLHPHNIPFHPQVNAGQGSAQMEAALVAHLINSIQSNAMRNPLRIFTFNLFSANRYDNQYFRPVITEAVQFLETSLRRGGLQHFQNDPNKMMADIANTYSVIATFAMVKAFPGLAGFVTAAMANESAKYAATHQQMLAAISQTLGSVGQPPQQSPYVNQTQTTESWQPPQVNYDAVGVLEDEPGSTSQVPIGERIDFHNPQGPMVQTVLQTEVETSHVVSVPSEEYPVLDADQKAPIVSDTFTSESLATLIDPNTTNVVPTTPYLTVYDPHVHTPVYMIEGDDVKVVLTPNTSDNAMSTWDYREHELQPAALADTKATLEALPTGLTGEGLANLRMMEVELEAIRAERTELEETDVKNNNPEAFNTSGEHDVDLGRNIVYPSNVMLVHYAREASMVSNLARLANRELGDSLSFLHEYFYRVVVPFELTSEQIAAYGNLMSIEAPEDLQVALQGLVQSGDAIWLELDRRLTTALHHALEIELQTTTWKFTSFAEDYTDLLNGIIEDHTEGFVELFKQVSKNVVCVGMASLGSVNFPIYINGLIAMGVDVDFDLTDRLLVLSEYCSMTKLPLEKEQLSYFFQRGILATEASSFYRTIHDIVKKSDEMGNPRNEENQPRCRSFITIKDKSVYEIHPSAFVDDVYLLRPVDASEGF